MFASFFEDMVVAAADFATYLMRVDAPSSLERLIIEGRFHVVVQMHGPRPVFHQCSHDDEFLATTICSHTSRGNSLPDRRCTSSAVKVIHSEDPTNPPFSSIIIAS
jgi:hypothetical protein